MVINKLVVIIIYCISSLALTESFGADSTVVKDLRHEWYFYDSRSESYFPLVSKALFKDKTIHFDLAPKQYNNSFLKITADKPLSVFINNAIIDIVTGEKYYSIDSLSRLYGEKAFHIALYNKNLNIYGVSTAIVKLTPTQQKALAEDVIVVKPRADNPFQNFMVGALVIIVAFLAALYNYFPRVLSDFFKITKALALRESDENLIKSRPLSQINLLFYLYLSFLAGLVLMMIANAAETHMEAGIFYPEGFGDGIWKWLKLSLIIFGWLIVKLLLVSNMSGLFKLGNFSVSHYINYVRITLLIFTLGLMIIIFSWFGFDILSPSYYEGVFGLILVLMAVRVLILFFKLLSTASYKSLHLFSYLCGTEVIPYVILLYLGLNQPF